MNKGRLWARLLRLETGMQVPALAEAECQRKADAIIEALVAIDASVPHDGPPKSYDRDRFVSRLRYMAGLAA